MNDKALKTLEFDKIRDMLEQQATSGPGCEKCRNLLPSDSLREIEKLQAETGDAAARLLRNGNISFGSTHDIRASLRRLEVGSSLNQTELLQIAALLENAARIKAYGRHDTTEIPEDSLDPIFELLEPLTPLSAEIRRCILSE
ncbi:MAG: endonuclease MutS2, partial [Eubacterium sp.]|nr:endonuclease MutS2 [Eubacterium sp.]